jgi:magnesium transporter
MLTAYPKGSGAAAGGGAESAIWLDLVDPTDDERERAADLLGTGLPTRQQLASLALSRRIVTGENMLHINVPAFAREHRGRGASTPLGILLTPRLLVTLRYAESIAFDRLTAEAPPKSSVDAFVAVFASVAATAADQMESLSRELSQLSHKVFEDRADHSRTLRGVLFEIGRIQRHLTQVSSAMLGVERGLAHLCESAPKWIDEAHVARLLVVRKDLHALADFDQQMDDKLQFLLDATLGFINNDQNDLIKFLTIASVVTIPPIILAAVWGMNFKSIPEYAWPYGYLFAWIMLLLSMAVPLAWFRWQKWF